ncbi:MAG: hypothetical protein GY739_03970, partial [Mesoflavibacter sp.]|nr:hypothetical protein [Mesoflavibacter sp.]
KLIEDFDAMILQQNMRQNKDKLWCDMLDKIRIGAPLNRKEFVALNERVFPKEDLKNVTVDLTLYPTKVMVKERNNEQQEELINSEVVEFTHDATDIYSNNDIAAGCSVDDENIPDDDRDAGGLVRELRLSRDSKVMLVKNLGDGLINGSLGKVHCVEQTNGNVTAILVEFDDKTSGRLWQDPNYDNAVRIELHRQEYLYKGRYMTRIQFPIVAAWAVTIHKGQGMSLDREITNIGKAIFAHGQVYVALSRVRSLDGLYIEDGFTMNKWWQPKKEVIDFYWKLKGLYSELKKKLSHYRVKKFLQ